MATRIGAAGTDGVPLLLRGFRARERSRCAKCMDSPYLLVVVDIQEKEQVWTRKFGVY